MGGEGCTDLITQVPKLSDLVGKFFVNIEMFKVTLSYFM